MHSLQFGQVYRVITPTTQTDKPKEIQAVEKSGSNVHMSVGPFDEIQWMPPPYEGGTHVKEWITLTDEEAIFAARQLGLGVSMRKTVAENQAAINTYLQQNPITSKSYPLDSILKVIHPIHWTNSSFKEDF